MMKILFVSYCFGGVNAQVLIGVYKRCLRIAMELHNRGHDIIMYCTGRTAYHDELTETAEKKIRFVDIPFSEESYEKSEKNRQVLLKEISQINPDLIVIGEAPLAGALLDSTLAGIELEIPVVVLDNVYNPLFANHFCSTYASMADGIILSGPTSFQMQNNPLTYLHQVPPYIDSSPMTARKILDEEFGEKVGLLMTVLAYDGKVEKLGISLLEKLDMPDLRVLFLSRNPGKCMQQLEHLPGDKRKKARAITPPADPMLFGLLELSRLSVVKHGFMQVSECMALRTPVIVVYYEGPRWLDILPADCRPFAFFTSNAEADPVILEKARQFLNMDSIEMSAVHNGEFGAAAKSADFLEAFPLKQREGTWRECSKWGFTKARIFTALENLHPGKKVDLFLMRCMRLRNLTAYKIYSIICGCTIDGKKQFTRLWGRVYDSQKAAEKNFQKEYSRDPKRQVYYFSAPDLLLVEADCGQAMLPRL